MGRRYFTTGGYRSGCYESRKQGLLKPIYIWVIRDIIRSCLERLKRGILTVSFDLSGVSCNEFSYSLDDRTYPIIREGFGGLYLLRTEGFA